MAKYGSLNLGERLLYIYMNETLVATRLRSSLYEWLINDVSTIAFNRYETADVLVKNLPDPSSLRPPGPKRA